MCVYGIMPKKRQMKGGWSFNPFSSSAAPQVVPNNDVVAADAAKAAEAAKADAAKDDAAATPPGTEKKPGLFGLGVLGFGGGKSKKKKSKRRRTSSKSKSKKRR